MRALLVYATVEGQTRKIADEAAKYLEDAGWQASVMNAAEPAEFSLERPTAVILLAPVHANDYPEVLIEFIQQEAEWLNSLPTAFISVSLSIHSDFEDEKEAVLALPEALALHTGWQPDMVHHAAGALKFNDYDFFKKWLARHMTTREAKAVDTHQNYEFTDWDAVKSFVLEFAETAKAGK